MDIDGILLIFEEIVRREINCWQVAPEAREKFFMNYLLAKKGFF
jgi:hypothetical protein